MTISRVNEEKYSELQPLENLADSHYVYASVGVIDYATCQSSGVYLGNQIVLTVAHAIPAFVPDNQFISSKADYGTFTLQKENAYHFHAKIIWVNRHPDYMTQVGANDIALLIINLPIHNAYAAPLLNTSKHIYDNCIAVGFTSKMTLLAPSHTKRIPLENKELKKVAVKIPQTIYDQSTNMLLNIISCTVNPFIFYFFGSSFGWKSLTYDPFEAGLYLGMSGGGCFFQEKLFGINCSGTLEKKDEVYYSHSSGDELKFVPLDRHREWIKKVSADYKRQLPTLMTQDAQHCIDYKINNYYLPVQFNLLNIKIYPCTSILEPRFIMSLNFINALGEYHIKRFTIKYETLSKLVNQHIRATFFANLSLFKKIDKNNLKSKNISTEYALSLKI